MAVNSGLKRTEITIRRRVECEEKAFHIVNKLIDGRVSEQYLSDCGKLITRENYDDVIEERAISMLCGYPVCEETLPNVPRKKYHISTKANKVYDISERKNFCSNQCFKASKCFKLQIPESPVWAREDETIEIFVSPHKSDRGLVGDEVIGVNPTHSLKHEVMLLDETGQEPKPKDERKKHISGHTHSHTATQPEELEEVGEDCDIESVLTPDAGTNLSPDVSNSDSFDSEETLRSFSELKLRDLKAQPGWRDQHKTEETDLSEVTQSGDGKKSSKCDNVTKNENTSPIDNRDDVKPLSKLDQLQKLLSKKKNVLSSMVDSQEMVKSKPSGKQMEPWNPPTKTNTRNEGRKKISTTRHQKLLECSPQVVVLPRSRLLPLQAISRVLKSWMSVSTVDYLQFRTSSSQSSKEETQSLEFSDLKVQVNYANLCKNLDQRGKELNSVFDGEGTAKSKSESTQKQLKLKSVPDYTALKEEAGQFQLKAAEFITGKKPTVNIEEKSTDVGEEPVYIPTVDAYDQLQIRARIVLEKLDKSLPDVLVPLGLRVQDMSSCIRELVHTFRLERDTITFKPAEWTLISLLLLKMLSFRLTFVDESFKKDSAVQYFTVLLKAVQHTLEDLEFYAKEILSEATVDFKS